MKTEPTLGLFLCNGGQSLSSKLDFDLLKNTASGYGQVKVIQEMGKMCSSEGIEVLKKAIDEHHLDGLVLAACNLTQSNKPLKALLTEKGLETGAMDLANLRELCAWNIKDRDLANRKAQQYVRQSIEKMINRDELHLEQTEVFQSVLVLGHGWSALKAARELARTGRKVILACDEKFFGDKTVASGYTEETSEELDLLLQEVQGDNTIEKLIPSRLVEFNGEAGRYHVVLRDVNGVHIERSAGGVIVAPEPGLKAHFEAWGLEESDRFVSLAYLESHLPSPEYQKRIKALSKNGSLLAAFLLGFTHTSNPASQKRAFNAAMRLAENQDARVVILMEHFKVADEGLETLSQKARESGVIFAKVPGDNPPRVENTNGDLTLRFFDDVLGEEASLSPHLLVLEEELKPRRNSQELQEILQIQVDAHGFFQGDNVYNLPIYTNRAGIMVIGPARGAVSPAQSFEEARESALEIHEFLNAGSRTVAVDRIKLDRKKCTICLTCYRLCPHRAISIVNRRPVFSDLACKTCGICASECPMDAIQIHNYTDVQLVAELSTVAPGLNTSEDKFIPSIVAFCCQNSALEASNLASYRRLQVPVGLDIIEVPCAGKVDMDYVMKAFREGADGVMVLGCHPESCKSMQGSTLAQWRVEMLKEMMSEAGLEPERLVFGGLAAGMSREFARMTGELEEHLIELGESPIRKSLRFKKIA